MQVGDQITYRRRSWRVLACLWTVDHRWYCHLRDGRGREVHVNLTENMYRSA